VQVLIPVFALGRAQELCILLDTYWERMNLKVPIYFSAGRRRGEPPALRLCDCSYDGFALTQA